MRSFCAVLAFAVLLPAQDAREIVRRAVEGDKRNVEIARSYTFLRRQQQREMDAGGQVKKVESDTYDITLLEGSQYRRHVAHNDQALSAKERDKEEAKLQKSIEERRRETPEQRQQRIQEANRRTERDREPLKEIPDAYDLKLAGEEKLDGIDTWVVDATPRPGYRPKHRGAAFFPKARGRMWIARQDFALVKVAMETLDTVSFGGFLIRMAKGSHVEYQAARVNNEVWLPRRIVLRGAVRIALVKMFRGDITFDFSEYKKFQTDSRVVAVGQ